MKTMMQFSLVAINGRGFQPRTVERSGNSVGQAKIQIICNLFWSFFDQVPNKGFALLVAGQFETRLQEFGLWTF